MTEPDEGAVPSARFPRERHLRRRVDFLRVQQLGRRVVSKHFVFLLAARIQPGPSRLGITVTRKVGTAVVRNRAKRLIREVFRHLPFCLPEGIDMVVVVRSPLIDRKAIDVMLEWEGAARALARQAAFVLASAAAQSQGGQQ